MHKDDEIIRRMLQDRGASIAVEEFAKSLVNARQTRGLSQNKASMLMRIRQSSLCALEHGDANPTAGNLGRKLALLGYRLVVDIQPLDLSSCISVETDEMEVSNGSESKSVGQNL